MVVAGGWSRRMRDDVAVKFAVNTGGNRSADVNPVSTRLWQTMIYQPPHDIKHHQPGPW
jgi:hypothetical protein